MQRLLIMWRWSLPLLLLAPLSGCGSDGPAKAPVKGTVTTEGQPVTGGSITFLPIAGEDQGELGRPATGEVNSDGTFVLGTEGPSDGAAIGRHRVIYSTPAIEGEALEWDGTGTPPEGAIPAYTGLVPREGEVEVQAGENEVNIELVPGG